MGTRFYGYLCLLTLGIVFHSQAQTEKGTFLIGTSTKLDWDYSLGDYPFDEHSFLISPEMGSFVADDLLLGFKAEIYNSYQRRRNPPVGQGYDESFRRSINSFSVYLKYFLSSGKTKPFVMASYGLGRSSLEENLAYNVEIKTTASHDKLAFGGGLAFFFSDKISADLSLRYISTNSEDENFSNDSFGADIGFFLYL